jgi:Polyketide cyclase / dehydrase and lipid transport
MAPLEAQNLINARGSTVWEIITDSGNFAVWGSGITEATGELRNGGTIRVRTRHGGSRSVRLRVEQIPGGVMTWTWAVPPRLGVFKRTFVLTPRDAMTLLVVRDEISGPLRAFIRSPFGAEEDLTGFVAAVKERAEILG